MAISTIGASALDSGVSQLGKNLIDNGAMTVTQRGAAATALTGNTYTQLDRWRMWENSAAEYTTAQDTASLPSSGEFGYALKVAITTADASIAAGDFNIVMQRFEGQNFMHLAYNTASAKTLTFKGRVRNTKTGVICAYMYQVDANKTYVREITIDSANTWQDFEVTFPGDTAAGTAWNNDSTVGVEIGLCLDGGTTYQTTADAWQSGQFFCTSNQINSSDNTANTFHLTGVQLEVGSVATDFEHEDYGTTLAKCQRYFLALTQSSDLWHAGYQNLTSRFYAPINFAVEMRAAPTATSSAASTFALNLTGGAVSGSTVDAGGLGNAKRSGGIVLTHATTGAAGDGGMLQFGSGAYVHYSAEL
jgi:hypothetical protein